jgi:hypothetical protein
MELLDLRSGQELRERRVSQECRVFRELLPTQEHKEFREFREFRE